MSDEKDELTKLKADYDVAVAAIDELKGLAAAREAAIERQARQIKDLEGDKAVLAAANETLKKGFESQQRMHTEAVDRIASLKKRELAPVEIPADAKGAGVIK